MSSPPSSTSTPPPRGSARADRPSPRRGAPGSAAGRRDREHVDGRGALGDPGLAVGACARRLRRDAARRARRCAAADAGVARDRPVAPSDLQACRTAVPALRRDRPLARAGRRQPDGVLVSRAARQEAGRRGSKQDGWRYAHRNCISPCALSVSARSSSSAVRSRKVTTCRSPSRSTCSGPDRRSTSTARSCGRSSSRARARSPAAMTPGSRSTSSCASRPPRSSRAPTPARSRPRSRRSSARSSSRC